jgi:DNA-binding response OmpR family regulator
MAVKMLIIDDDRELCLEMADIFRDAGYAVDEAALPELGLAMLKDRSYDVCLLDYKMPGMTGIELLKKLDRAMAHPKFIMLTGAQNIEHELEREGLLALVAMSFHKPFSIEVLIDAVNSLVK